MLKKRAVIFFFSSQLVYLYRSLAFFTLPKQITFCGRILFFALQPGHVEKNVKTINAS